MVLETLNTFGMAVTGRGVTAAVEQAMHPGEAHQLISLCAN